MPRSLRTPSLPSKLAVTASLLCIAAMSSCLPAAPASGRQTPVQRVAILGDSISHGLFGTTPSARDALRSNLAKANVELDFLGYPGDSVFSPQPGQPAWATVMQREVNQRDPDVIIIQSINFPESMIADRSQEYLDLVTSLFVIAQSRGAHVYIVAHGLGSPPRLPEFELSQRLQQQAATDRGIELIPSDWWLERCETPLTGDEVHLTQSGIECYVNSIGAAVRQLQNEVG